MGIVSEHGGRLTLAADIVAMMKCAGCADYIRHEPPFYQCGNCHSVCTACRTRLRDCSTCDRPRACEWH